MSKKKTSMPRNDKTRILIVDDHWVVVEGIKSALDNHGEFEVVGTASDGIEAIKAVKSLGPDIVVMDISMRNMNGIEATYEIKKLNSKIRIIIFSMYSDKEYILSLFTAGISGYVLKEETTSDLILALKSVKGGGTYFSRPVQETIQQRMKDLELGGGRAGLEMDDGLIRLSIREKELFPLLADGLSSREISKRLNISPKTVESHKYNIMDKLNAKSVSDLTKIALRKNLIKL